MLGTTRAAGMSFQVATGYSAHVTCSLLVRCKAVQTSIASAAVPRPLRQCAPKPSATPAATSLSCEAGPITPGVTAEQVAGTVSETTQSPLVLNCAAEHVWYDGIPSERLLLLLLLLLMPPRVLPLSMLIWPLHSWPHHPGCDRRASCCHSV